MSTSIHVPYADYELSSVRTLLGTIFRTANAIENAAGTLRDYWGELPAHLSGSAVATTGYYSAMTVRTQNADDLVQMLRAMWRALDRYADDAHTPLTNLARLKEEAVQWQSRRPKDVVAPPGTPVEDLWAMQAGYVPGTVCMAQSPWATWNADRARIESDVRYWASEYERIADVCAAALRRVNDPTLMSWWEQIRASIAARGFNDFAPTGEQLMIYQAVTLGDKLIAGELDEAGMTHLEQLLTTLADNPEAAATFWTTVGGARTLDVLLELDGWISQQGDRAVAAKPVALAARESLSVGSQDWTATQATRFTDAMWDGVGKNDLSIQTVSFLFNRPDEHPMGLQFTIATANMFDSWERDPFQVSGGPAVSSVPSGGLMTMAFIESEGLGRERVEALDPMARVLSTLALDSDASLAWFTDGSDDTFSAGESTGEARIAHWYGNRSWDADRFSGAGAVWESAMSGNGGIGGGSYEFDSSVMTQQAALVTGVLGALGAEGNPHFTPGDLSSEAQVSMGNALSASLPWLIETSITANIGTGEVQFLGTGEPIVAPVVHDSQLARVWGTVAIGPDGLRTLDGAVAAYRTQAVAAASLGDVTGVTWNSAMIRIAGLEGLHQGSSGGVEQYHAKFADEQFAAGLDKVGTVVGLVPIPGSEKLPALVGELLDSDLAKEVASKGYELLVDAATDAGTDYAVDRWGSSFDSAISRTNGALLAGEMTLYDDLTALADSSPPGFEEQLGSTSVATWRGVLIDVYSDSYKSSLTDVGQPGLAKEYEEAPR